MSNRSRHPVGVLRAANTRAFFIDRRQKKYPKTPFRRRGTGPCRDRSDPPSALPYDAGANLNSDFNIGSIVLLPRDIESEAEAQLERSYGSELTSEVLFAPHHEGITLQVMPSSSASSRASWCSPLANEIALVIFTVGWLHGKVNSLARLYNTVQGGMISYEFSEKINKDGEQKDQIIHISQYRKRNSRYWH